MKSTTPQLLPLSAMARRLNVKPSDLRAAVRSGEIPVIRIGDSLLFDPVQVERALAERAKQAEKGVNHG